MISHDAFCAKRRGRRVVASAERDRVLRVHLLGSGGVFQASVKGLPRGRVVGKKRGVVKGQSDKSRGRLIVFLRRVDMAVMGGALWCTVTYSDPVPPPEQVARDEDTLVKRLRRRWPFACGVWVREVGSSGERVYNPHLHLIVWKCEGLCREVLLELWRGVTAHSDVEQVWCEYIGDVERVAAYVSKYVAKGRREAAVEAALDYVPYLTGDAAGDVSMGRSWGVFGRKYLVMCEAVEVAVVGGPWFHKLRRSGYKWYRPPRTSRWQGFKVFVRDWRQWMDYGLALADQEGGVS